jgi:tRNA/rRNA methyltransferase
MAVHAQDLLEKARTVQSLAEAVADCRFVVGTTCRGGLYRAHSEPPETVAARILRRARTGPVALVFGPEDHGLSNEDLKHCHQLIAIPTSERYSSLNLAQAVLICCYELRKAACGGEIEPEPVVAALAGDVEFALERLKASLLRIGFLDPQNPEHIMFALRRIFGRIGLEERDVRILLGLARQIDWYARDGWRRDTVAGDSGAING